MNDENLFIVSDKPKNEDTLIFRSSNKDYYLLQYSKLVEFITAGISGSGMADSGANGIIKRTALNVTAPAVPGVDYEAAITILSVAKGGTGTAAPGLVAGTNITITGTWPNQTINSTGGGSSAAEPFTSTAYAASLTFDITSVKEKNFDITGFNGNLTIAFSNMNNGASSSLRLNKTTASAITVTFPANTTIICNTPDCVVSGDVVTVTSASGTKYVVNTTKVGTDLVSVVSRVDVDENYTVGAGVTDGDKGDITVSASGATWTINAGVVTYAKMQNISATNRFLGRITAAAGVTEELTGTQATTLLDIFTSTLKGLVPLSGGGTTNFLRADGTWAAAGGGSGIPLTGTTTGNQVTGPVKFGNAVYIGAENSSGSGTGTKLKLYDNDAEFTNGPTLLSDATIVLNHNSNFNGNRARGIFGATLLSLQQVASGVTNQIDIDSTGIKFSTSGSQRGFYTGAGSLVIGSAAIATSATDGFVYQPSMAGTPTGVPTSFTGRLAFTYDSTNDLGYIYNGSWKLLGNTPSIATLTDAATVTINATNRTRLRITLTDGIGATRVLANPTGMTDGKTVILELVQGGTGNKAVTFDTKYQFGSDITSVTLSTTAGKTDYLQLLYNASRDKFDIVSFIKGY